MAIIDVTWANLVNATIDSYGDLTKTAGSDNCGENATSTGDAGAWSQQTITAADGDWEFRCTLGPSPNSGRTFVGLTSAAFSLNFATWQYCLYASTVTETGPPPHPANTLQVFEGTAPSLIAFDGVWNEGRVLRFVCRGNVLRYYLGSRLLFTSGQVPVYPLRVIASIACLNKTVLDAQILTADGHQRGPGSPVDCSAPWTIPSPAELPLASNGGPRHAFFQETEADWNEIRSEFRSGGSTARSLQSAPVRAFEIRWDGLSEAEALQLDTHWQSTSGGLTFTLVHPLTAEVITGVRYIGYSRSSHQRVWSQERSARLVKHTN